MRRRTLIEHRPWLLVSIAAAIAYWLLRDGALGGLFVVALKGMAVGALAIFALLRRAGPSGALLAGVMALGALGDVTLELWGEGVGGSAFFAGHMLAISLYLRHHRHPLARTQLAAALALIVLVPVIGVLLTGKATVGFYGIGLGAMAAAAWTSTFSRYRVGAGALLFVASDLILFAQLGGELPAAASAWLVWPLYYTGQLMIATGVIRALRAER